MLEISLICSIRRFLALGGSLSACELFDSLSRELVPFTQLYDEIFACKSLTFGGFSELLVCVQTEVTNYRVGGV